MTLGIAMCTYNGEKYIGEQLSSILSQTLKPDKMIICDDGSSDSTVDILKKFACQVPFDVEIVINKENLGSTKNFEKAIHLCDTDIIVLSDQDDVWLPEKLQKTQTAFEINPECGYVFTDAQLVDEKLNLLNCTMWETINFTKNKRNLFKQGYDKEILIKDNMVTGATMAFKGTHKELLLPIPACCIHDAWIALVLTLADKKGVFIDEPMILYRQHAAQQIGAEDIRPITTKRGCDLIYSIDYIGEEIRKAGLEHDLIGSFDYRYVRDLIGLLQICYSNPTLYKSPEKVKEMEFFAKERFSKISLWRIFSNRHLKISYKIKAVRLKSGIYKLEKMIVRFFR